MPVEINRPADPVISRARDDAQEPAFRNAGQVFVGQLFNKILGKRPGTEPENEKVGWGNVILTAVLGAYSVEKKGENTVSALVKLLAAISDQLQGARAERVERLRNDIDLAAERRDHADHKHLASLGQDGLETAYNQPLQPEPPIIVDGKERTSTFSSGLYRFDTSADTERVLRVFDRPNNGHMEIGLRRYLGWIQVGDERVTFDAEEPAYVELDDGTKLVFGPGKDRNAAIFVVKGESAALVDAEGNLSWIESDSSLRNQVESLISRAREEDRGIHFADLGSPYSYQDDLERARQRLDFGDYEDWRPGDEGPEDGSESTPGGVWI